MPRYAWQQAARPAPRLPAHAALHPPKSRQAALLKVLQAGLLLLGATSLKAETVPLCVGDFPPYNSAVLPDQGPVLQITREAFERVGLDIKVEFLPWARLLKLAEAGECAIVGLWRNAEREQIYEFSSAIVRQELGLFGRVGRARGELRQQLIGIERSSYVPEALNLDEQRRYPVQGIRQNFTMLAHDRIDLALADRGAGEFLLKQRPDLAALIEWKGPRLEYKDAHLAATRSAARARAWVEAFERGLAKLRADGSHQRILKQAGLMMPG